MRKILWSTAFATIVASTLSFMASIQPSEAMIIYPWCAHYGGRNAGGAPSCGSTTFAQCMATVSGMQGYCNKNPWYVEPAPTVTKRTRKRAPG